MILKIQLNYLIKIILITLTKNTKDQNNISDKMLKLPMNFETLGDITEAIVVPHIQNLYFRHFKLERLLKQIDRDGLVLIASYLKSRKQWYLLQQRHHSSFTLFEDLLLVFLLKVNHFQICIEVVTVICESFARLTSRSLSAVITRKSVLGLLDYSNIKRAIFRDFDLVLYLTKAKVQIWAEQQKNKYKEFEVLQILGSKRVVALLQNQERTEYMLRKVNPMYLKDSNKILEQIQIDTIHQIFEVNQNWLEFLFNTKINLENENKTFKGSIHMERNQQNINVKYETYQKDKTSQQESNQFSQNKGYEYFENLKQMQYQELTQNIKQISIKVLAEQYDKKMDCQFYMNIPSFEAFPRVNENCHVNSIQSIKQNLKSNVQLLIKFLSADLRHPALHNEQFLFLNVEKEQIQMIKLKTVLKQCNRFLFLDQELSIQKIKQQIEILALIHQNEAKQRKQNETYQNRRTQLLKIFNKQNRQIDRQKQHQGTKIDLNSQQKHSSIINCLDRCRNSFDKSKSTAMKQEIQCLETKYQLSQQKCERIRDEYQSMTWMMTARNK